MRNRSRLGVLTLALLLASLPLAQPIADPPSKPEEGATGRVEESPAESVDGSTSDRRADTRREESDSDTFVPSEKISLDRPISFPVDI
jgi:hypothetical protein